MTAQRSHIVFYAVAPIKDVRKCIRGGPPRETGAVCISDGHPTSSRRASASGSHFLRLRLRRARLSDRLAAAAGDFLRFRRPLRHGDRRRLHGRPRLRQPRGGTGRGSPAAPGQPRVLCRRRARDRRVRLLQRRSVLRCALSAVRPPRARGRGAGGDAVCQPALADVFHGRLPAAAGARAHARDRPRGAGHRTAVRLQYRGRGGRRVRLDLGAPPCLRPRGHPADQRGS